MIYCKNCGGKLYEEEEYVESDIKMMQLGCYLCYAKVLIPMAKWNRFKKDLTRVYDQAVKNIAKREKVLRNA